MADELKCPVPGCGASFESQQGLSSHITYKHPNWSGGKLPVEVEDNKKGGKLSNREPSDKTQTKIEQLITQLELPSLVDGQSEVFDEGVQYGMRSIVIGVRLAQELSSMGVSQATPIIKMAQEMRMSENEAARIVASELAAAQLESNKDNINAIFQATGELKSALGTKEENQVEKFISTVQAIPQMFGTMQQLMSMFGMKVPMMGQQPLTQDQQSPLEKFTPPPIEKHSKEELSKEEDDAEY